MVIRLHENQFTQVRNNNDLSEPFKIKNGMKQGCVLAPILYTVFFSMMLQQVTKDLDDEDCIYIYFCANGNLFNLKWLQAYTKTLEQMIIELLFADNATLVAHSEPAL